MRMNMKKILTSFTIVIAFVLLMTITVSAAFTSSVLSNPTYSKNIDGIIYKEAKVTEGGTQKIFYGEYNTTTEDAEYEWVIHSIRDGSNTTLSTVMNIAKDYEAKTGRKVMLATNGDYFYNTGANVESYVNNGIVITKGNMATKNCIGFDNNGKVVVGRMTEVEPRIVVYDANNEPQFLKIDKFNEQPAAGEIAIYNVAGSYTVTNAGAMVVKATTTNLTAYPVWGSDYTMTATGVQSSKTFTLKSGQYAIVYTAEHNDVFGKHVYGEPVDLVEIPAGQFAGCTWVLGGYDILVNNKTVNTNCHTDNSGNAAAPRTFFGFKADGTGFLCVVDGRGAGGSTGITVNQEAQLAGVLGAQFALELDGGGSSTMIVRINDTLTLRNTPSDGSMRSVSNAIMLVEKPKKEEAPHQHVYDDYCLDTDCNECGETREAPGHSFTNYKYTAAATCVNNAVQTAKCDHCDAQSTREVENTALGHNFVDGVCTRCKVKDPTVFPPECTEHTDEDGNYACDVCGKELLKPVVPEPPVDSDPVEEPQPKENFIVAFFRAIFEAIAKFFMELFS